MHATIGKRYRWRLNSHLMAAKELLIIFNFRNETMRVQSLTFDYYEPFKPGVGDVNPTVR
jgi:hypothetical protein